MPPAKCSGLRAMECKKKKGECDWVVGKGCKKVIQVSNEAVSSASTKKKPVKRIVPKKKKADDSSSEEEEIVKLTPKKKTVITKLDSDSDSSESDSDSDVSVKKNLKRTTLMIDSDEDLSSSSESESEDESREAPARCLERLKVAAPPKAKKTQQTNKKAPSSASAMTKKKSDSPDDRVRGNGIMLQLAEKSGGMSIYLSGEGMRTLPFTFYKREILKILGQKTMILKYIEDHKTQIKEVKSAAPSPA